MIIFNYLGEKQIRKIVELELEKLSQRVNKTKAIYLRFSKGLENHLAQKGFDPAMGARPLKRLIQKLILDPLSLRIITSQIKMGSRVLVDFKKDEVILETSQSLRRQRESVMVG